MQPPITAPATAQTARRGARGGSDTASGANTAPLGPGTTELCITSHVAVAVPDQPDSAHRCNAAMTRESMDGIYRPGRGTRLKCTRHAVPAGVRAPVA